MATEPSSSELTDADKERINAATRAIVSRSAYSKLRRLVTQWKEEEESRKTVLIVALPLLLLALFFLAVVVGSLVPVPKPTLPKGPHTLFPGQNAATPVKQYEQLWRDRSQAGLDRVCVPMPSYLLFTAYVNSSGRIERIEIERSSGNVETDRQIQQALLAAGPLPAFSEELRAVADVLAFRESVRASGEKCARL